jgi:hypothetical protein
MVPAAIGGQSVQHGTRRETMAVQRCKELFSLACLGTLLCAVLGTPNFGGIDPFHSWHVGPALDFFVLTIVLQAGAIAFQMKLWMRLHRTWILPGA